MADYYITIFLDDEKIKKIEDAGLAGEIREIDGKKAIQVEVTAKEHKKLLKGFPDLTSDSSNAYVVPEQAENSFDEHDRVDKEPGCDERRYLETVQPLCRQGASAKDLLTTGGAHRVAELTPEEQKKKAIFDAMSERSRKRILDKGYEQWDPFLPPKDPIDLRMSQRRETALSLMRRFLRECPQEEGSNEYGQGAWETCMGITGGDDRWRGSYDFSCWYRDFLRKGE